MQTNGRFCDLASSSDLFLISFQLLFVGEMMGLCDLFQRGV